MVAQEPSGTISVCQYTYVTLRDPLGSFVVFVGVSPSPVQNDGLLNPSLNQNSRKT